ncbi:NAD-dependent DNA ligase LigA [Pseudobacteriovorax antillogorgiicola]|uniref:DNA ligase n=1 Tax=Pseudobacteriovorax antillogorgiicola TaxID=1513793 RepID=A0A1Y6C2V0_9BACT|nr:NAD-dependent DNA ligase LigA [Pseudobacteriovorax antillogorgiicola]TCS50309.1 DNA ligase (NAD+) [Pseudobacteriovorax antillogorgiicola]SMF34076.1 DNA ligase (NAD+) [Pseudobacteriovorax antillogorgiicola]
MTYKPDAVKSLADAIMRHKRLYYQGKPEISDADYDRLEDQLRQLAPEHPALEYVGSDAPGVNRKVAHETPMLSLQKTYVLDDLISWKGDHDIVGTWKVDGNSLSLVYKKGQLVLAKTRGNGRLGEDVTSKAQWVSDLVPRLQQPLDCEIRGELYCTEHHFAELVDEMLDLGLERPSNPRNIVAGLLGRRSHLNLARYFNFLAFEVLSDDSALHFKDEIEKFAWLTAEGFPIPEPKLIHKESELSAYLDQVKSVMEAGEIGLDGAVFSFNNRDLHYELGNTSHHPRYKMSYKWQGQTAVSVIKDITWATSRLGVITPVAVIEPVTLSGAKITNITLHNAEHVMAYNLKKGDEIEIVRSGEVIPKFLEVKKAAPGRYSWPAACGDCNETLEFDGVRLRCLNEAGCPAQQTGFILNWIRCAEIDDLSEKRLAAMQDLGLVSQVDDLYHLSVEDFLKLPLTKEKMAQKLWKNVQKSKTLPLARFLNGLGIQGTGLTSWEKILEDLPSLDKVRQASEDQIKAIDGFAEKTAQQIVAGLSAKSNIIDALLAAGLKPKAPSRSTSADGIFGGQTFVITGTLSKPRAEIEGLIKQAGGKTSSSVSKKTTAVITNDPDSGSSKMKKAQTLGIPVWSEDNLLEKLEA